MRRIIIVCLVQLCALSAGAQLKKSVGGGFGVTDNANVEDQNKDTDLFYKLQGGIAGESGSNQWRLRLGYVDYLKESVNDNWSGHLSNRWREEKNGWSYYGAVLGRVYSSGGTGFTEGSFNHWGWDASAERTYDLNSRTDFSFGPGAKGRYYSGLANRSDHFLFGHADLSFELSTDLILGAASELGYLHSADADYKRLIFDLSGNVDWIFSKKMNWFTEVGISSSSFSERTAGETVIFRQGRGKGATTTTIVERESYSYFFLFTEITRKLRADLDLKGSFTHSRQSSKSGFQNYAVNELYASVHLTF